MIVVLLVKYSCDTELSCATLTTVNATAKIDAHVTALTATGFRLLFFLGIFSISSLFLPICLKKPLSSLITSALILSLVTSLIFSSLTISLLLELIISLAVSHSLGEILSLTNISSSNLFFI